MRKKPREIILTLKKNQGRIRATARMLGISPGTVIFWKKRARSIHSNLALSSANLERKSTRPKTVRETTIVSAHQDQITIARKETNYGAIKLRYILGLDYHRRTVHRFLDKRRLIPKQTQYRRPKLQPTTHMHTRNAERPGYLQMDVKYITPELSGLPHTCFEYAVIDIYSRYKQAVIVPYLDAHSSVAALKVLLPTLPFGVHFIQTDNGAEFQSAFDNFLESSKIKHHFIHKRTPNENAVIERSFRTDEEEFFFWRYRPAKDLHDLNSQFQIFLQEYNFKRPHLSLNLMTPMEKFESYS
ncbi:MAG: DDE-type integrase/transposase/recombinase [Candidatus Moranbacteria bacterium]|nr:DDE-type integrase/transposase/recombinase [Candidatus Moranbacteria bacterium]